MMPWIGANKIVDKSKNCYSRGEKRGHGRVFHGNARHLV
jgi:hypothetical protein